MKKTILALFLVVISACAFGQRDKTADPFPSLTLANNSNDTVSPVFRLSDDCTFAVQLKWYGLSATSAYVKIQHSSFKDSCFVDAPADSVALSTANGSHIFEGYNAAVPYWRLYFNKTATTTGLVKSWLTTSKHANISK